MDKSNCIGCREDFYNGNNTLGVKECWNLKTAELIMRKEVSVHQVPPWNQAARLFPKCYCRDGYIYISPEKTC